LWPAKISNQQHETSSCKRGEGENQAVSNIEASAKISMASQRRGAAGNQRIEASGETKTSAISDGRREAAGNKKIGSIVASSLCENHRQ